MSDRDVQPESEPAPEADAHEQRQPVIDEATDRSEADPEEPERSEADLPLDIPIDVDPADAYEQTLSVEYDEDEYR
ncbi:hypothetical protein [Phytoactinopolyspora halotolerans]|uniref:Uncharacterized protein n=1 Tax=Phytoactinopolyspora halotolerans TaxID=1981512 RepID=A0A6L9SG63_9ACTN|nr:hypothetical protein [Phytoactinopolyspora halotolerans]NEE04123.1 hypothetical protein [Phytoactinopolyspora halotolerans]